MLQWYGLIFACFSHNRLMMSTPPWLRGTSGKSCASCLNAGRRTLGQTFAEKIMAVLQLQILPFPGGCVRRVVGVRFLLHSLVPKCTRRLLNRLPTYTGWHDAGAFLAHKAEDAEKDVLCRMRAARPLV